VAEYSKSVKRGLVHMHAAAQASSHLDADLLTAFAEQTLTRRERDTVLAHLADCADCRDIIALSVPEQARTIPPPEPVKPLFWRWPVLRWGAVAASVVIVAVAVSVGNLEHNRAKQQVAQMKSEAAATPATSTPGTSAKAEEPQIQLPVSSGIQRQKIRYEKVPDSPTGLKAQNHVGNQQPPRDEVHPTTALLAKDKVLHAKGLNSNAADIQKTGEQKTADLNADAFIVAGTAAKPAPPPPPASANETVEVTAQAGPVQSDNGPVVAGGPLQSASAKKESNGALQYQTAPQQTLALRRQERFAAPTNWHVTSTGILQRSYDRGQTWEQALPATDFRAVTAIGNDIWAGGANALLVHSVDAGQTWQTLSPGLKGDVTSLQFTDSRHGLVKTSANESWQTDDAGKTWKKQ
jgi:Photosynthesis system II assembly factor YCF48/Putative zinc-finger